MMNSFELEILTPERAFYRGPCVSLVVPVSDGMLGVMANCEPVIASLTVGEAYYTPPDGERILFSVSGGMIDVQGNCVKLLCESALLPEEIDCEQAEAEAEAARCELAKSQCRRDYLLSTQLLKTAVSNLKIKEKSTVN